VPETTPGLEPASVRVARGLALVVEFWPSGLLQVTPETVIDCDGDPCVLGVLSGLKFWEAREDVRARDQGSPLRTVGFYLDHGFRSLDSQDRDDVNQEWHRQIGAYRSGLSLSDSRPPAPRPFEHGLSGYSNHRCKCEVCTEAYRARHRDRKAERAHNLAIIAGLQVKGASRD
jgi:hypothetical protein